MARPNAPKRIGKSNRFNYAAFSGRMSTIFRKASQISERFRVDIAVVIFFPDDRIFCFGNPCVRSAINRFLAVSTSSSLSKTNQLCVLQAQVEARTVEQLRRRYLVLKTELEALMDKSERLSKRLQVAAASNCGIWWRRDASSLGPQEVKMFRAGLENLEKRVIDRANELFALSCLRDSPLRFA